jgi:hypothetical protein
MKLFYFVCLFLSSFLIQAQHLNCGVTSESWEQEMLTAVKISTLNNNSRVTTAGIKYIPLTIHFVRHTNGTYSTNTSVEPLYQSLMMVNRVLNTVGIQFYVNGNVNYINNDAYLKPVRGSADHDALLALENTTTANIWVNDGWLGSSVVGFGGPAGLELSNLLFATVVHELGHFFTLAHTFHIGNGLEHVARTGPNSNCTTAGDGICDTHADPYNLTVANAQIQGQDPTQLNCSLTSNTKDLTGTLFTPPYDNIMSYYIGGCGMIFTPGQYARILNGYNQYHTAYTDMTGAGIVAAPTNVVIVNKIGYDIIQWQNKANAVATQVEISSDNGATWLVMNGELSNTNFTIIHNVKRATAYLLRARHLNSLAYSTTVAYSPSLSAPIIPVYMHHATYSLPSIGAVAISNTPLNQVSGDNQNYSIYSPTTPITLYRGGLYSITITNNTPVFAESTVGIWIDENQDGDFEDTNELKYHSSTGSSTNTTSFFVSETCDTGYVRLRVRSFYDNAAGDSYSTSNVSEIEDYVFKIINGEQPQSPYCNPISTVPCGGTGSDYGIQTFSIPSVTFANTSATCGVTSPGYSDFTTQLINLTAGQTYAFVERNPTAWAQSAKYLDIYLDANQNSIFESTERLYTHVHATTIADPVNGSIVVSANAMNGATRLRIRAYYNPIVDACGNANFGETEDYTVVISGGKEARVINTSITNITANSMVLHWQKKAQSNPTGYIIKISTDGQNFTSFGTALASATSFNAAGLQPNTRYYYQIIATNSTNSDAKIVYATTSAITTAITPALSTRSAYNAYPNPATNELHIVSALLLNSNQEVQIKNILGQYITCAIIEEADGIVIQTSNLSKGVYFVVITTAEENQVIRFVKE